MKSTNFRSRRRVVDWLQTALMLGIPFLRVSGESPLRFDVPSLRFYLFGSVIWISKVQEATFVYPDWADEGVEI